MDILFFVLSAVVLYGAFQVVTHTHLVVCALHLAGSMLALAGLFFILGATVYCGGSGLSLCRCSDGAICNGSNAF